MPHVEYKTFIIPGYGLIRAAVGAEHASTVTDAVGFEYECTTRFRVPLAPQRPTEPDGSVNPDLYIAPQEE